MIYRNSAQINTEIYNIGPELFKSLCEDLLERATIDSSQSQHEANKALLQAGCNAVINEAGIDPNRDHRALWQAIWPRIVYAGTLAAKATKEIASMRALVPMFQDLDNFSPERYVFDESEWKTFTKRRKDRLKAKADQANRIQNSIDDPDWKPAAEFARTTAEVWKVLTKDRETYPGLLFSAMPEKVTKYLDVAKNLHTDRANGNVLPLNYYTGGQQFKSTHLVGQAWVQERKMLDQVRARFETQLGTLTALHTMMDMGLKTIKPDRVMTYLFSQLGWLQTLPSSWSKKEVVARYMHKDVIREMTIRADVFAASLDRAGLSNAHRRLDIWFVKFGQEPENDYGITVNLQDKPPGIRGLLERVLKTSQRQNWWITDEQEASKNWPAGEFIELVKRSVKAEGISTSDITSSNPERVQRRTRSVRCMSRDQAEKIFVHQWKAGLVNDPTIYPSRETNISNDNKERILRKIERCEDPHESFVNVLKKQ